MSEQQLEVETVLPETPMAVAETPSIPEENNVPEVPTEQPTPEISGPSEVEVYQDILAKFEEDPTFEMDDAQSDAFLSVQEQVANGQIEDPKAAKLEEAKTETPKETEPQVESTTGEKPVEVAKDVGFNLSDDNADQLHKAMSAVGAKDIGELDSKIGGLLDKLKTSGGQLGDENKALRSDADNHRLWLKDLGEGKQSAIDYLNQLTGGKHTATTTSATNISAPVQDGEFDPSKFLDDELAGTVKTLMDQNKELANTVNELKAGRTQEIETVQHNTAITGWVDDVVKIVESNQNFGLTTAEARGLAENYFSPKGQTEAIHPKFQQIHELLQFAHKKGMPDLKSAHVVWQHENGTYAQKIIDATKDGQKSVTHKESVNSFVSQKQSRTKANVPSPHIEDTDVSAMERGDFNSIPDEWTDDQGNLIPSKVPERFHKEAFGKLGKPK